VARRILLVDDDPTLLQVLATVLDLEDFEVRTASGGLEAVAVFADEEPPTWPDVVVCDVSMPDLDGLEVCRRLKADPASAAIPVILLTARGAQRDRDAGAAAGCDAYLTKPFSPLELIDLARSVATSDASRRS
jgi:CheY-like chemotaxis protein